MSCNSDITVYYVDVFLVYLEFSGLFRTLNSVGMSGKKNEHGLFFSITQYGVFCPSGMAPVPTELGNLASFFGGSNWEFSYP